MPPKTAYDVFLDKQLSSASGGMKIRQSESIAIRELLSGKKTPAECARKFTTSVTSITKAEAAKKELVGNSVLLHDLIVNFPDYSDKFVELIEAIKALPAMELDGKLVVDWSESIYFIEGGNEEIGQDDSPTERINLATLKAKLVGRGSAYDVGEAHPHFCFAFENLPATADKFNAAIITDLDTQLRISQQWILYAGKQIYESSQRFPHWTASESKLWKGDGAYSKKRWAFWKERAVYYSGITQLSRKSRDVAKEIVEMMNTIETEN